jgi:hypothetical protein
MLSVYVSLKFHEIMGGEGAGVGFGFRPGIESRGYTVMTGNAPWRSPATGQV